MTTSVDRPSGPKGNRGTLSVKILVWSAVVLFFLAFLLAPRGVTVFWSAYLLFFGPVIVVDLAAIVGFVVCVSIWRRIFLSIPFDFARCDGRRLLRHLV